MLVAISSPIEATATRYGASYNGSTLGCGGTYVSGDSSIIAVGGRRDGEWPCGTLIQVCGPNGCLYGLRQDSCPGCSAFHVDLSEAGIALTCGAGTDVCDVRVQALRWAR